MNNAFSVMIKPRGAICNLACSYCYYLTKEHLYNASNFRMSTEVLTTFIRQYIAAQPGPEVLFAWQGGEPLLMGIDFYRRALTLQKEYCPPEKFISNTIQTNGILIDDEWCRFFAENRILVGISLDGPGLMHDAYRGDKSGQPTFSRVMSALRKLKRHGVEVNILTAVHAANVQYPMQVYTFLRDEVGAEFIQFLPVVETINGAVTFRSVGAKSYGLFLSTVFEEWRRRDVGRVFVQLFDTTLGIYLGFPASLCLFQETCGNGFVLEHNGDIYACDHFVHPDYRLGNLLATPLEKLVQSPGQRAFGTDKRDKLPRFCQECDVNLLCNGECPKNRFTFTPTGEPGLNYLCEGYKTFFRHADAPMRRMASAIRHGRQPVVPKAVSEPDFALQTAQLPVSST